MLSWITMCITTNILARNYGSDILTNRIDTFIRTAHKQHTNICLTWINVYLHSYLLSTVYFARTHIKPRIHVHIAHRIHLYVEILLTPKYQRESGTHCLFGAGHKQFTAYTNAWARMYIECVAIWSWVLVFIIIMRHQRPYCCFSFSPFL